ncbi:MAG: hypothetical protein JRG86_01320 [Deltaproteobacteria bacterium]|jgi:hypothetical protein|nr:hypothetical protein [Deltaproteobacteria bacterium]MBW2500727.1 hypothetical protein [Deltaproteobacteria bacterium]
MGLALLVGMLAGAACVPPRGGWDVRSLRTAEPALAELRGERLGDLTPFPAWIEGELALVACRWASGTPVVVRASRPEGVPEDWLRVAVRSVDGAVPAVALVLAARTAGSDSQGAEASSKRGSPQAGELAPGKSTDILVVGIVDGTAEGPIGVADTLTSCDVSARPDDAGRVRGELRSAEIEIRFAREDVIGRMQPLLPEEWVGAAMHELGHALGFAGHVARGDSILVREQGVLRAAGRRALSQELGREPSLEALYRLEPGRRLGQRALAPTARRWLMRLDRALEALEREGIGVQGPRASVGDRHARLEWWIEGRARVGLRFPDWSRQLREGGAIFALPDATTRGWLEGLEAQPSIEESSARARARS